ncbi:DNA repair protein RecO [bacterium]
MRNFNTEAMVLKTYKVGERDLSVRLLTKEFGKVSAWVKGIRKIKNRYGAYLEIFSELEIGLYRLKTKNTNLITDIKVLSPNYNIRLDMDKFLAASFILKFVDSMTVDETGKEIYPLLTQCLELLSQRNIGFVVTWFVLKFLSISGYQLIFDKCSCCNIRLNKKVKSIFISPDSGGIVCKLCESKNRAHGFTVSGEVFDLIKKIEKATAYDEIDNLYTMHSHLNKDLEYVTKRIVGFFTE